jgi:hypothetical protein
MILNKTKPIADSLTDLRVKIMETGAEISTEASEIVPETIEFQTKLLTDLAEFAEQIKEKTDIDRVSIERLYETILPEDKIPDVLKIVNTLSEHRKYLHSALTNYDEEIYRENEMSVFFPIIYKFDYMVNVSSNFRDVITAIKMALFTHKKEPFKREQISALIKVIDLIKKNINVPNKILDEILDVLEMQFDIAGPLSQIEFK